MKPRCKDLRHPDRAKVPSIKPLRSGWPNGLIILPNTVWAIYCLICQQVFSSMTRQKLSPSLAELSSTIMRGKLLLQMKSRTWWLNTASPISLQNSKRRLHFFSTSNLIWNKTMILKKKNSWFKEINWIRQISCCIHPAVFTSRNGWEPSMRLCLDLATKSFK